MPKKKHTIRFAWYWTILTFLVTTTVLVKTLVPASIFQWAIILASSGLGSWGMGWMLGDWIDMEGNKIE